MSSRRPAVALCAAGLFAPVAVVSVRVGIALGVPAASATPTPPVEAHISHAAQIAGPPPGHTGGFGEPTCATCHIGAPLNEPGSTLQVLGLEGGYRPGQRHPVTIRFESFDMLSAGFQASFRFQEGARRGTGAGESRPLDDRVTVVRGEDGDTEYVQHTRAGTEPADGVAEWTFEWRAPETETPVALHVAANSGSGDDSPLDDLVYTLSITYRPAAR
ncbi:choice-of-anchor V domain-containing protein [Candidatus Palauibacter sp.]|uniref:choice-of-anchor V domain-containing protein n=1 Tax=Candidatus Palauibacter sp. TaxID=3101350 RepID=UPI003B020980